MTYPSPEVLVCFGRGDHARHQRRIGRMSLGCLAPSTALLLVALTAAAVLTIWDAAVGYGIYTFATCIALITFAAWVAYGLFAWIAAVQLANARRLAGLLVRVDASGITVDGRLVAWHRIRHIVVTQAAVPGQRMLLVDDGNGLAARIDDAYNGARALRRRAFGRQRFAVELPLESLSVEPTELIAAIRHHSAGRFPDLVPSTPAHDDRDTTHV